jgi:hypothetical protein
LAVHIPNRASNFEPNSAFHAIFGILQVPFGVRYFLLGGIISCPETKTFKPHVSPESKGLSPRPSPLYSPVCFRFRSCFPAKHPKIANFICIMEASVQ